MAAKSSENWPHVNSVVWAKMKVTICRELLLKLCTMCAQWHSNNCLKHWDLQDSVSYTSFRFSFEGIPFLIFHVKSSQFSIVGVSLVACSYSPRVWGRRVGSRTRWTFFLISTAGALVVQSKGCYLPLCICCRIHFCCQVLLFPPLFTLSISGSAYRCVFFQDNQSFG